MGERERKRERERDGKGHEYATMYARYSLKPFLIHHLEYFVDDLYTQEINRDNPLGWQGRIAEEYGGMSYLRISRDIGCLLLNLFFLSL